MQLMLSVLLSLCVVQAVLEVRVQAAAVVSREYCDCCQVIYIHTQRLIYSWISWLWIGNVFSSDVCKHVYV